MRHCCSTRDGGTSSWFCSLSLSTICSASAVSARSFSAFSSFVWMSARSSTSVSNYPTSLANSSSSVGRTRSFTSLTGIWNVRLLAGELSSADARPGTSPRPRRCRRRSCRERRVELGDDLVRRRARGARRHPRPLSGTRRRPTSVKSIVTTSPFRPGAQAPGASRRACWRRRSSSCSSTASSVAASAGRTSSRPSYSTFSISG